MLPRPSEVLYGWMTVALYTNKTKCTLCGRALGDEEVEAFGPFLTPEHRLWPFSDSAMHRTCYGAWPERALFDTLCTNTKVIQETRRSVARTPEAIDNARRAREQERGAEVSLQRRHDDEHARIMALVRASGAACPHCGAIATAFRELTTEARARLVCNACHRSCFATELKLEVDHK